MSLASWKAEFYPTEAFEASEEEAVAHSLKKWIGLRPENLKKHNVFLESFRLRDGPEEFSIDAYSCALCVHYNSHEEECAVCPLKELLGKACDELGQPYDRFLRSHSPEPMISALERLCL